MPDYKAMYFKLAEKVADAVDILIEAQIECEELFICSEEPKLMVIDNQMQYNNSDNHN